MSSEFDIIRRYFTSGFPGAAGVVQGVGDDAALLAPPPGSELAVSCDTLVEGVHFPDGNPADIGYRSLAVNLSDLAAMGAEPRWFTLAITVPQARDVWFEEFSAGLRCCAEQAGCALIGGDTTRGPLSITIQVIGEVPAGQALLRNGARPGDSIFVSGKLGSAAAWIASIGGRIELPPDHAGEFSAAFWRPVPRSALGIALRGIASAAIDLSDGLIGDLGHILRASGVGATIHIEDLPIEEALVDCAGSELARELATSGGDDYQLCFTVPASRLERLEAVRSPAGVALTRIGVCDLDAGLVTRVDGEVVSPGKAGYRHFDGDSRE